MLREMPIRLVANVVALLQVLRVLLSTFSFDKIGRGLRVPLELHPEQSETWNEKIGERGQCWTLATLNGEQDFA